MKIDVQGAGNIKKMYPDAVSIFIMPPSMEILETRLRNRGSEEEDDVLRRLKIAIREIERCRNEYDYVVINDDLKDAVDDIKTIITAETHRVSICNKFFSEVCKNV